MTRGHTTASKITLTVAAITGAGSALMWEAAADTLAPLGRIITYDRGKNDAMHAGLWHYASLCGLTVKRRRPVIDVGYRSLYHGRIATSIMRHGHGQRTANRFVTTVALRTDNPDAGTWIPLSKVMPGPACCTRGLDGLTHPFVRATNGLAHPA